jgi:molybdopterin-guanine dinucleotide biosynthesis protein A
MGRDKALLPFRGGALAQAVAHAVEQAAGSAVLIGNPQLADALGYPAIPDLYPGEGPLGGILTALAHSSAEWNLITACDMPELTAPFLAGLLDAAARADADVLVPQGPAGRPEPLCAVYHARSRPAIEAAFQAGERKVMRAFGSVRIVVWPVREVSHFQNVNTPEDWAAYGAE